MAESPTGPERVRHPQSAPTGPALRRPGEAARREPGRGGPNPEPKRSEVSTFTLDELAVVADELANPYKPIPVFAALTGLRPCEWSRSNVATSTRQAAVVTVRRTVVGRHRQAVRQDRAITQGPPATRTSGGEPRRLTPRLDTRLLFPGARGGPIALSPWRNREWTPAVRAAGARAPNDLRAQAHVREPQHRRGGPPVRVLPVDGHVAGDARQDVPGTCSPTRSTGPAPH